MQGIYTIPYSRFAYESDSDVKLPQDATITQIEFLSCDEDSVDYYVDEISTYYMNSTDVNFDTYPYIIQSQYRTGYKTHSQDGSRTTLIMTHGNENLDMCDYNTTVESISRTETNSQLILKPVVVEFSDGFTVKLQTVYDFENGGDILITRRVIEMSDDSADFKVQEYVKASYGFTEYAEDMKDITLYCDGEKVIDYTYRNTEFKKQGGGYVAAVIPDRTTEVKLCPQSQADTVSVKEGNLFGPFFTLKVDYNITNDTKEVKTRLRLSKTQA